MGRDSQNHPQSGPSPDREEKTPARKLWPNELRPDGERSGAQGADKQGADNAPDSLPGGDELQPGGAPDEIVPDKGDTIDPSSPDEIDDEQGDTVEPGDTPDEVKPETLP